MKLLSASDLRRKARWLAFVYLACGCSTIPTPTAVPAPTAIPASPMPTVDPGYVTATEYGDAWPFTVPAGTIRCYDDPLNDRLYIIFNPGDGIEYGLNGSARDFGFREVSEALMPELPDRTKTLDLIQRGLALCAGAAPPPFTKRSDAEKEALVEEKIDFLCGYEPRPKWCASLKLASGEPDLTVNGGSLVVVAKADTSQTNAGTMCKAIAAASSDGTAQPIGLQVVRVQAGGDELTWCDVG